VDRAAKEQLVSDLHQVFEGTNSIVVTHYIGLSVNEMEDLRRRVQDAGARFKVTKNRLTRLALAGTQYEGLTEHFNGPTAIAYSEDPVAAAKATVGFSKTNEKLVILGGAIGTEKLDSEGVKALASLPSLDELRAKLVGLLSTPATRVAGVLQAPAGQVSRVLARRGEQAGDQGEAA